MSANPIHVRSHFMFGTMNIFGFNFHSVWKYFLLCSAILYNPTRSTVIAHAWQSLSKRIEKEVGLYNPNRNVIVIRCSYAFFGLATSQAWSSAATTSRLDDPGWDGPTNDPVQLVRSFWGAIWANQDQEPFFY